MDCTASNGTLVLIVIVIEFRSTLFAMNILTTAMIIMSIFFIIRIILSLTTFYVSCLRCLKLTHLLQYACPITKQIMKIHLTYYCCHLYHICHPCIYFGIATS